MIEMKLVVSEMSVWVEEEGRQCSYNYSTVETVETLHALTIFEQFDFFHVHSSFHSLKSKSPCVY